MTMKKTMIWMLVVGLLVIAGCGGGQSDPLDVEGATGVVREVTIENFKYYPESITIAKGDAIKFINRDKTPHTATANDGSWDSDRLEKDDEWTKVFTEAGDIGYYCAIHPSMKGGIRVQ